MSDEVKTVTEDMSEESVDNTFYDDENDPEWDNVKWVADPEDEDLKDGEDDINGKEADEADHSEGAPAETDGPAEEAAEAAAEDTDQYLELKHFDEIRKVGKDEAKALAQKGLDYDNIRGERDKFRSERDELKSQNDKYKEMEDFLNEVRGDQFKDIDEFMMDTRARMRADANGTRFEDELATLKAQRVVKEEPKKEEKPSPVDEFIRRFPQVKAEEIPESVWAEVRESGDLVGAYVKYTNEQKESEIKKLQDEIEALKQNQENAYRSAGSSRSAGNKSIKSTIAELWDNGE